MNFFVFFALLVGLSCCYNQHVSENGNVEKLTQREELRKSAHRRSDNQSSFASKRSVSPLQHHRPLSVLYAFHLPAASEMPVTCSMCPIL